MNSCGLMGFLKSSKQSENSLKEIDAKRKIFVPWSMCYISNCQIQIKNWNCPSCFLRFSAVTVYTMNDQGFKVAGQGS